MLAIKDKYYQSNLQQWMLRITFLLSVFAFSGFNGIEPYTSSIETIYTVESNIDNNSNLFDFKEDLESVSALSLNESVSKRKLKHYINSLFHFESKQIVLYKSIKNEIPQLVYILNKPMTKFLASFDDEDFMPLNAG